MVDALVILLAGFALLALPRGKPRSLGRAESAALDRYDDRTRADALYPFDPRRP